MHDFPNSIIPSTSLDKLKQLIITYDEGAKEEVKSTKHNLAQSYDISASQPFVHHNPTASAQVSKESKRKETMSCPKQTIEASRYFFSSLQTHEADLLVYLLIFLNYVTKHSNKNKMSVKALSVCFTPALVNSSGDIKKGSVRIEEMEMLTSCIGLLIEHCDELAPKDIYNEFIKQFNNDLDNNKSNKVDKNMNINNSEDVFDYVNNDRKLYRRPEKWNEMTHEQLVQEYLAYKTAMSFLCYNYYVKENKWPDDKEIENCIQTVNSLKELINDRENKIIPNVISTHKVSIDTSVKVLPKSVTELSMLIADLQTEMIELQKKINELPPKVVSLQCNDIKNLALRRVLLSELTHCYRIHTYIKSNIYDILKGVSLE